MKVIFFCYLESSITIGNTTQNQQHDRMQTVTYSPTDDIQKHFFDWVQKCRKDIEVNGRMCVIRDCKIIY